MTPKFDHFTEENLRIFLSAFYDKVKVDPLIGPIFIERLGRTEAEWAPHMDRVVAFWASVLLKTGGYQGKLVMVHNGLAQLSMDHFRRWVQIFMATVPDYYSINPTCELMMKAQTMMRTLHTSYEAHKARKDKDKIIQ